MISVICSSEILFCCTFLQSEKGVFSLPKILAFMLFSLSKLKSLSETALKLIKLLSLIRSKRSFINFRAF